MENTISLVGPQMIEKNDYQLKLYPLGVEIKVQT